MVASGPNSRTLGRCLCLLFLFPVLSRAELAIRLLDTSPEVQVGRFEKFEISFLITGSASGNPQWPFDPEPPAGIPPAAGISVDAIFVDPTGREHRQPGFFCQEFQDEIREGREWVYPTDRFVWKVRFSPNLAGEWQYRITARDRGGSAETPAFPLLVAGSSRKGFIRVSRSDPRYFEYDDGTLFTGLGLNLDPYLNSPVLQGEPEFRTLGGYGVNFVRIWISSIFGSAWTPYVGARNRYGGYLPITGLIPFSDPESGQTTLTMRIDYEPGGDLGWFDACRFGWSELPEAVKPRTTYKTRAKYRGIGIEGPRRGFGDYGFVVKLGGWFPQCYEPGTSRPVTGHGRNNSTWGYVEGSWNSGNRNFLPRMYLALENARRGAVYVQDISLREDLGGGRYGPEIMTRSSMEHHLYVPEKRAYALDKILRLAERYGIYLKMV
ncbi:MAG: DUF5060 domain-containing protein, partial [Acidobacteria bacterium]|nr:DUF5060 domain-containing protein [Acidobacteriota bacterium]